MLKSIINFFRAHFDIHFWVCLALMAIAIAGLIALNTYVLDITQDHYNIFELIF